MKKIIVIACLLVLLTTNSAIAQEWSSVFEKIEEQTEEEIEQEKKEKDYQEWRDNDSQLRAAINLMHGIKIYADMTTK